MHLGFCKAPRVSLSWQSLEPPLTKWCNCEASQRTLKSEVCGMEGARCGGRVFMYVQGREGPSERGKQRSCRGQLDKG